MLKLHLQKCCMIKTSYPATESTIAFLARVHSRESFDYDTDGQCNEHPVLAGDIDLLNLSSSRQLAWFFTCSVLRSLHRVSPQSA